MTTYTTRGLTTAFTPPDSCYGKGLSGTAWADTFGSYTTTVNYYHDDDACYPYSTSLPLSYGTFSPGMCPGGYTTALKDSSKGLTTAACCPSDYDALSYQAYCTSKRTTSASIDCLYPDSSSISSCAPGLVGPGDAVQFAIHVLYASSDLSDFPDGYTAGGIGDPGFVTLPAFKEHVPGATITPGGTIGSPTATPTGSASSGTGGPTQSAESGGASLSSGAKAGIGVGVAIIVLALLSGILFLLWRRRRAKKTTPTDAPAPENNVEYRFDEKQVVSPTCAPNPPPPVDKYYGNELDGRTTVQINELAGAHGYAQHAQELPHSPAAHMLDAHTPAPQYHVPAEVHTSAPQYHVPAEVHAAEAPRGADFGATTVGPASALLFGTQHDGTAAPAVSTSAQQPPASPPPPASPAPPSSSPTEQIQNGANQVTIEDVELKYLEEEERRIRERKEAILASRKGA